MTSHLRLGSFNLLSGRSLTDGRIEAERLVEATRMLDVDVLAVQEVDRNQPRSGRIDQAGLIALTLGALDHRFVPALDGTPGEPGWTASSPLDDGHLTDHHPRDFDAEPDGSFDPAQFGVGLISRLPVLEWHVLRLRPARGTFPLAIPSRPPQLLWLNDEPRVAVAAVLESPRVTIACTHLSFVPTTTVRQLARVRDWLTTLPGPQFLLGDLNLPGPAARRITGWTPLISTPTFPSPRPRLQLDHVLAAGLPAGTRASGRALRLPISDHRAVEVELDFP